MLLAVNHNVIEHDGSQSLDDKSWCLEFLVNDLRLKVYDKDVIPGYQSPNPKDEFC